LQEYSGQSGRAVSSNQVDQVLDLLIERNPIFFDFDGNLKNFSSIETDKQVN